MLYITSIPHQNGNINPTSYRSHQLVRLRMLFTAEPTLNITKPTEPCRLLDALPQLLVLLTIHVELIDRL